MAGTTSPFNKAANVLQANAENIFIAALAQMVKPRTPFRYGFGPSVTDMSSGYDMYYTLDTVLWKYSSPRMAHAYGIPSGVSCGGGMTCRYDVQTGAEGMLFMQAAYESGADLLNGIGSFCNAVGMSAEMMIIQTAWLDAVEYLHRGIGFEEYTEALESIQKVGPGGNFLAEDLTLKNLRSKEFFQNECFDMSGESGSGTSMLERAHNRVEEITEGFVSPLPENVQDSLKAYFREIYKKL
jgi:trimethylamine--corrinoid protein Co-methyltransferase